MDFAYTPEQQALRREVRQFIAENVTADVLQEIEHQDHPRGGGPLVDAAGRLLGVNSMVPVETNNVGVVGEHWISHAWAINYNALIEDRGIEGLKPEIRLGLRLRF